MIDTLIDKEDNFEKIRDQIALILFNEVESQMALATAAGKVAALWKLRIFIERSNPWEEFLQNPVTDRSPLVNVWYQSSNFDTSGSNTFERKESKTIYNIDCYGYGQSSDVSGGGHDPGDERAALTAQRAVRLVRNILEASIYSHLGLENAEDKNAIVWDTWMNSMTTFQPEIDGRAVQQIVAIRLSFAVNFNEFSPQFTPETLEFVSVDIKRENGELVAETDYDYTSP